MNKQRPLTHILGYPRIGAGRELKRALESYWKGQSSRAALDAVAHGLRLEAWKKQQAAGIDWIPSNDFSYYDQVLDMTCLLGNVPARFHWDGAAVDLDLSFKIARGEDGAEAGESDCGCSAHGCSASEMTKWFDTNYHYIVPEFHSKTQFKLSTSKVFDEFNEALQFGIKTKPVLIGPVTYLSLGKVYDAECPDFDPFTLFENLIEVYVEILQKLRASGAEWVQIDEPILSGDLSSVQQELLRESCRRLKAAAPDLKILLANYFGGLGDYLSLACELDCDALHIDAVRAPEEVPVVAEALPQEKILSLGLVNGRNVWRNDYAVSEHLIALVAAKRRPDRYVLASSCSLLHTPIDLEQEARLDDSLKSWLAFADQKLVEISDLAHLACGALSPEIYRANASAHRARRESNRIHNYDTKERVRTVADADSRRASAFVDRQKAQRAQLPLPAYPTTTIGSFPQTKEVRRFRAQRKRGEISEAAYLQFLKEETQRCIEQQEAIGLDLLVHGEFERNDMVEYFGEQLEGFAFTQYGWVQSYGSRCVKPPLLYGDVSRPKPMTVDWALYAQSLTSKPVKGMLTGPVTILQWSFVRDDQPRSTSAKQIALAIRDEVQDLEAAGVQAIQIDEAAFREGLPLRRKDWQAYLDWAVEAFRLTSSGVKDATQIHTHMCYSEFNDIIASIIAMDADVITIESARSDMELLKAFARLDYPAEIGPGIYDIHSPRVPPVEELSELARKALEVLPADNFWINPDCGLKTRNWAEVTPALERMVQVARDLRVGAA